MIMANNNRISDINNNDNDNDNDSSGQPEQPATMQLAVSYLNSQPDHIHGVFDGIGPDGQELRMILEIDHFVFVPGDGDMVIQISGDIQSELSLDSTDDSNCPKRSDRQGGFFDDVEDMLDDE